MKNTPALELIGINKHFGQLHVNKAVSLQVLPGTIHGLVGENGAGKSTLVNIIYGFYRADSGTINIFGQKANLHSSQDAIALGIGMVHQHFMLVQNFTVLENVMLGAEGAAFIRQSEENARQQLSHLAKEYGLDVPLDAIVEDLPVGIQQRVEILKTLYRGAKILILDEPTSVLTPQETADFFQILSALRTQGVTVILISHKLEEIMSITDQVSVIRAGAMVSHHTTQETSAEQLAELMVGRKVSFKTEKKSVHAGKALLEVDGLSLRDDQGVLRVDNLSFTVHAGEVVGLAGVSGNGQTQLIEALAAIRPLSGGQFRLNDQWVTPEHAADPAILREWGLAHVPEDRIGMGLVTDFSAYETAVLGYHDGPDYNRGWRMDHRLMKLDCETMMAAYDVRPPRPTLLSGSFSGGNQQKLVLAREIERDPQVLLIAQPTRGVDIGAIEFIHRRILRLREQGKAIFLVSAELEEIMALSDRILVMYRGRITGEIAGEDADKKTLGLLMANLSIKEQGNNKLEAAP